MTFSYRPTGVCSTMIDLELEDGIIQSVQGPGRGDEGGKIGRPPAPWADRRSPWGGFLLQIVNFYKKKEKNTGNIEPAVIQYNAG